MNQITFENYPFQVEPLSQHDGGGYVIRFPDLPGCMSDGETVEEAITNGRGAFEAWVESAIADGVPIPQPNGHAEPAKFVQRLPKSLHTQLLRAAANEGTSMNTYVTMLVAEGLSRRERSPARDYAGEIRHSRSATHVETLRKTKKARR
jgi:antitoxin HicB